MTQSKHTPLPWRTTNNEKRKIVTVGGVMICRASLSNGKSPTEKSTQEADANAEFIVRACNAHDDLVAALEKAVAHYTDNPIQPQHYKNAKDFGDAVLRRNEMLDEAEEALAKAKAVQS